MWHVIGDTWNMKPDMREEVNILSKFQLPSSYSLGVRGGVSESAGTREHHFEANKILWGKQGKAFRCFVAKSKVSGFTRNWYPNILWYYGFWLVFLATCEVVSWQVVRPSLPVRGSASLWEAKPPCKRLGLPVRGPASLWEARPPCERPCLPVRGPASL